MIAFLKKYGLQYHLTQGLIAFALCFTLYLNLLHPNLNKDVKHIEQTFQSKIDYLESSLDEFSNSINYGDELDVIWDNTRKFRNLGYDYFVFEKDSLLYWTASQIVLRKPQMDGLNRAVLLLENGWYALSARRSGDYTMIGLFLIKHEYPYQNENLVNAFNPDFDFNYQADIQLFEDEFNINYPDNELAFSLARLQTVKQNIGVELILFFGFIGSLIKIGLGIWRYVVRSRISEPIKMLGALATLLVLRIFLFWIDWKSFFPDFDLFNPNIFASSALSPTLGDLIINAIYLVIVAQILIYFFKIPSRKIWSKPELAPWNTALRLILFFGLSHLTINVITKIIFNSDVSLEFYNFMSLSPISFLFLLVFFALLWAYFKVSLALLVQNGAPKIPLNILSSLWFLCAAAYLIYEVVLNESFATLSLFPLILSIVLLYFNRFSKVNFQFTESIALLGLFALFLSVLINHTQNQKELSTREIYAKKLISEKELETEMEYAYTASLLQDSELLQNFFANPDLKQVTQIKRLLERKFFQDYWSRYEIDFHFYDADTVPISTYVQIRDDEAKKIEKIIQNVGLASDVSEHIFYVSDFTDNLSYVVRQPILDSTNSTIGILYLGMRSKVIPQEIGFPRLLLNDYAKVFFKLENYNMAKYVNGKLALRYGSFNYPLTIGSFLIDFPKKSGALDDSDYVHLVSHGESNKTIILTKERVDLEEYLTTFSFLFSTFGIFLIVMIFVSGKFVNQWNTIKLAFRIQLLFIALVFFALLFSGIGTGTYVKKQYLEYQEGQLREKVSSVEKELQSKLEYEDHLNEAILTNYLEFLLNKFSSIFITDINLYSTKGGLLASSRPEIFNLGLLGTQMNARAFRQMYNLNLSLYVNQESIGNQEYLSAYVPLNNAKNEVIAYINLPYFAKQGDFDDEIAGFLSAIINIFVLLLALSVVIAVFITSKIVDPLKQIQASLSDFRLGKSQQPIAYKGNDEIGVLVREYNAKLKELQESSEKLAQSEREMAWREMAKQVAHEIKNPLTPMKLKIQHFQRAFDPNAENADERIQKFSESLIEQIDALTNIANAFSNFAKMPRAKFENVDIVHIMQSAVETFSAEENVVILAKSSSNEIHIEADNELLLRVFNNLIKNAIQAIPPNTDGEVIVTLTENNQAITIRIQDNGTGIDASMKDKIFVPNFTTKSTGTGLGLAMVKQIVVSHQGEITFESQPGQTTFTIQLPKKQK